MRVPSITQSTTGLGTDDDFFLLLGITTGVCELGLPRERAAPDDVSPAWQSLAAIAD